jgi:hypothetical protein
MERSVKSQGYAIFENEIFIDWKKGRSEQKASEIGNSPEIVSRRNFTLPKNSCFFSSSVADQVRWRQWQKTKQKREWEG